MGCWVYNRWVCGRRMRGKSRLLSIVEYDMVEVEG